MPNKKKKSFIINNENLHVFHSLGRRRMTRLERLVIGVYTAYIMKAIETIIIINNRLHLWAPGYKA